MLALQEYKVALQEYILGLQTAFAVHQMSMHELHGAQS